MTDLDYGARMYCDEADVTARADLRTPRADLQGLIRAATARIERYCGRVFHAVPATGQTTRHFLGSGATVLSIDDLLSWATVTVDGASVSLSALRQMPFGSTPTTWVEYKSGATWAAGADVAISGVWGFADEVPWDVHEACVVLCVRALEQAKAGYQDASAIPEVGQLVYRLAMPREVAQLLGMYRRTAL